MKKKNGLIELYRFIASIIIMIYHSYHLYNVSDYPCRGGYIFVEAFFALTGYFTYLHFANLNCPTIHDKTLEVFKYIKRKFVKFLPYTFIAVFSSLIVRHMIILKDLQLWMFFKAVLESLMLIRGDSNVGVLWYLCALLWVFPLFCFSCLMFQRKTMLILSGLGAAIFYGLIRSYDAFAPKMFARAFAGLLLGVIIYELFRILKDMNINQKILDCLIITSLSIPIILTLINVRYNIVIILSFVLGFAATFAKNDFSEFWKRSIWQYLGKWSFSLYLVHLNIADLINWICKNIVILKTHEQYFMYIVFTIIYMLILEISVKLFKHIIKSVQEGERQ